MTPKSEPLWHVELAVVLAIVLQLTLAESLSVGPKYWLAILEVVLLFGLRVAAGSERGRYARVRHKGGLLLIGLVSIANILSLGLVIRYLIAGTHSVDGKALISSAISIFVTNIIIFGLWYWQLDGGGPAGRGTHHPPVDFLFPQMNTPSRITEEQHWQASFFDYLYVSITNATAFSPTDALPLTHRAKALMAAQGLTSLLTVALVAARAINILA